MQYGSLPYRFTKSGAPEFSSSPPGRRSGGLFPKAGQRIESEEEPTTDEVLEKLKKRRLKLKDEIAAFLGKLERRM